MIIGISGKMGTGKTVLAGHLAELCGGRVVSFADELRREVADLFAIPVHTLRSRAAKEGMAVQVGHRVLTIRELLQWWGALRRESDVDYWVRKLVAGVDPVEMVFVDDVRYFNEAWAIRQAGGLLLRLDPYPGWVSGVGAEHMSETDLDAVEWFDWRFAPVFGSLRAHAEQLVGLVQERAA